jgi:hypothetical protein
MKRVAALVKRLPDLTGAFHRFIENGPVPRRDLLEVFTGAPRTASAICTRATIHRLREKISYRKHAKC